MNLCIAPKINIFMFFQIQFIVLIYGIFADKSGKTGILYRRIKNDRPICPNYYDYCIYIDLHFHALFQYKKLLLDVGFSGIVVEKFKTYQLFDSYLTEYKVSTVCPINDCIFLNAYCSAQKWNFGIKFSLMGPKLSDFYLGIAFFDNFHVLTTRLG